MTRRRRQDVTLDGVALKGVLSVDVDMERGLVTLVLIKPRVVHHGDGRVELVTADARLVGPGELVKPPAGGLDV